MLCIAISIDFKIGLDIFNYDSEEKSDLKKNPVKGKLKKKNQLRSIL